MQLHCVQMGNEITIKLDFDMVNGDRNVLRQYLNSFLEKKPSKVLIDLSDINVITSVSLGIIVSFANRLRTDDIDLETIHVTPKLYQTIRLIALDKILGIQNEPKE